MDQTITRIPEDEKELNKKLGRKVAKIIKEKLELRSLDVEFVKTEEFNKIFIRALAQGYTFLKREMRDDLSPPDDEDASYNLMIEEIASHFDEKPASEIIGRYAINVN